MRIVGLLGGVASGKSLVARQFCELGAGLLDGDRAGHEVLRQAEVIQAARARWGERILGPDGQIDRAALGRIVFPPPQGCGEQLGDENNAELEFLEQLTHPRIGELLRHEARRLAATGKWLAVLDAAVMLKAGWDRLCDKIVFVDAPREIRLARALERGWSEEEFTAREAAQESLIVKRERADMVIDNSGSPEMTQAQVERLWRTLAG